MVEVNDITRGSWHLIGYYRYPNGGRRHASRDFFHHLANQIDGLWCIFGDFNDVMDLSEKGGRTSKLNWLINGFRQSIIDYGLSDNPLEDIRLHGSRV
jgi:hypothetical protein